MLALLMWLLIGVGIIDVPEFGVRDQRGDFDPLISGAIVPVSAPCSRN